MFTQRQRTDIFEQFHIPVCSIVVGVITGQIASVNSIWFIVSVIASIFGLCWAILIKSKNRGEHFVICFLLNWIFIIWALWLIYSCYDVPNIRNLLIDQEERLNKNLDEQFIKKEKSIHEEQVKNFNSLNKNFQKLFDLLDNLQKTDQKHSKQMEAIIREHERIKKQLFINEQSSGQFKKNVIQHLETISKRMEALENQKNINNNN